MKSPPSRGKKYILICSIDLIDDEFQARWRDALRNNETVRICSRFDPGSAGIILGVRGSNLTNFDEMLLKFDEISIKFN